MLALDTSALLKRYVNEPGRELVTTLMAQDPSWGGSSLLLAEARIAVCHAAGTPDEVNAIEPVLLNDWNSFVVVDVDDECLRSAVEIGCAHHVQTLDAIHLAAAKTFPAPCSFLTFDARQREAASALGLDVVPVDAQ